MSTVTKTLVFATGAEGLADAGLSASLAVAYRGTDGNPAGCLAFLTTANSLVGEIEKALNPSTGETWETWGVPSGATVTGVQITAWDAKGSLGPGCTGTMSIRVVDSAGASVHSGAGDLIVAASIPGAGAWASQTAGASRAVDSGKQASTTDVRFVLEVAVTTNFFGSNVDYRVDNIQLTITYSTGPSVYTDSPISHMAGKSGLTEADIFVDTLNSKGAGSSKALTVSLPEETNTSKAGGKSSLTEFRISYETPVSKAGGKAGEADVGVFVETVTSKAGAKSGQSDELVLSGGGTEYDDVTTSRAGAGSGQTDVIVGVESLSSRQGGKSSVTDVYVLFDGGNIWYDLPESKAGGKSRVGDILLGVSTTTSKVGVKGFAGIQAIYADTTTSKAGGKSSTLSSLVASFTTTSKAGGASSTVSAGKFNESVLSRGAGKSSISEGVTVSTDTSICKIAGKSSLTDQFIGELVSTSKAGGKSIQVDQLTTEEIQTSKSAGRSSASEVSRTVDVLISRAGGKSSLSVEVRTIIEVVLSRIGGKSSSGTVFIGADTPTSGGGAVPGACLDTLFRPNALIPALRYNVSVALPECAVIIESLSDVLFGEEEGDTPSTYLVIVAQDPRPYLDGSVMDVGVWIPVDFVYITKDLGDGVTDTPQKIRQRLGYLETQIQKDYHEQAGTLSEIVRMTETTGTPMSRQTVYQDYFSDKGQPIKIQVLSMEFAVVESMVCR